MSISFHCESCKKKIKAPDTAGGKWGNCPHCQHKCYIPLPASDDGGDELTLAPIDEGAETKYGAMMRETHHLTHDILHEMEDEEDPASPFPKETSEKELLGHIILYLRQMADGMLTQAEANVDKIRPFKDQAKKVIVKMTRAERPEPELADIPPRVLQGYIKDLHTKLGQS